MGLSGMMISSWLPLDIKRTFHRCHFGDTKVLHFMRQIYSVKRMKMNSPLMFGEWLRQRRDGLGLTRKEFAKRVGCSVSTLRKIENDERRPSGQIAELLANGLDIPTPEHSTFVRVARGELSVERLP